MITIYVLKCSNNKYYVGKTLTDVDKRFNTHKLNIKKSKT